MAELAITRDRHATVDRGLLIPGDASVYERTSFTAEELDLASEGKLYPGSAPRLPARWWRCFGDIVFIGRVHPSVKGEPIGHVRAVWVVDPQHPVFPVHFPGNPVFPGKYLADQLLQMLGQYAGHMGAQGEGYAVKAGPEEYVAPVTPSAHTLEFMLLVTSCLVGRNGKAVARGRGTVTILSRREGEKVIVGGTTAVVANDLSVITTGIAA